MKIAILLVMLNTLGSCNSDLILHNFTVTKYNKVSDSYKYSKDLLNYKGNKYKPIVSSIYFNDTLTIVEVYKPEGRISYNSKELIEDSKFKKLLGLLGTRNVQIERNNIIDNGKSYKIDQRKIDSVFCLDQRTLLLYSF
jgi:hypothetical protein